MLPVSPVAEHLQESEVVFAKDQPEYLPLPALVHNAEGATSVTTRWRPSDEERERIASGGDVFITQMTFGMPLQPLRVGAELPDELIEQ